MFVSLSLFQFVHFQKLHDKHQCFHNSHAIYFIVQKNYLKSNRGAELLAIAPQRASFFKLNIFFKQPFLFVHRHPPSNAENERVFHRLAAAQLTLAEMKKKIRKSSLDFYIFVSCPRTASSPNLFSSSCTNSIFM